jgi:hypothetical protein
MMLCPYYLKLITFATDMSRRQIHAALAAGHEPAPLVRIAKGPLTKERTFCFGDGDGKAHHAWATDLDGRDLVERIAGTATTDAVAYATALPVQLHRITFIQTLCGKRLALSILSTDQAILHESLQLQIGGRFKANN